MPHGFPLDPPSGGHKEAAPWRLRDVAIVFALYGLAVAFILFWIVMNQKASQQYETPRTQEVHGTQETT